VQWVEQLVLLMVAHLAFPTVDLMVDYLVVHWAELLEQLTAERSDDATVDSKAVYWDAYLVALLVPLMAAQLVLQLVDWKAVC